jgi:predicted ATPase
VETSVIKRLTVTDPNRTGIPHWTAIPALAHLGVLDFNPGLTIIWGPNGCGKSSLLRAVAHKLHCEQGGEIRVTEESLSVDTSGTEVEHDGQVVYIAPERRVGLISGTFDYDFADEGVREAQARGSSGQHVFRRLTKGFAIMVGDMDVPTPNHRVPPSPELRAYLEGSLPKTKPTIILDEPDISLDLKKQYSLYKNMAATFSRRSQIILTSHSPFAANLPGATYIDLQPGYLEECRGVIKKLM